MAVPGFWWRRVSSVGGGSSAKPGLCSQRCQEQVRRFVRNRSALLPGIGPSFCSEWGRKSPRMGPKNVQEWGRKSAGVVAVFFWDWLRQAARRNRKMFTFPEQNGRSCVSGSQVWCIFFQEWGRKMSRNGSEKCPGMGPKKYRNGTAKCPGMGPKNVQEWGRKMVRSGAAKWPGMCPGSGTDWFLNESGCWLRERRVARASIGVLLRWRWVCCVADSVVGCQSRPLAVARAFVGLPGMPCTAAPLLAEFLAEFFGFLFLFFCLLRTQRTILTTQQNHPKPQKTYVFRFFTAF